MSNVFATAAFAVALAGCPVLLGAGTAAAQPSAAAQIDAQLDAKGVATTYDQFRHGGFRGRGFAGRSFHGGRRFHGGGFRRRGYGGGALIGGLAAGALIGGAIASQAAPAPVYGAPVYGAPAYGPAGDDGTAYCMQRFKSYDPDSGTYLGFDGQRHPCP